MDSIIGDIIKSVAPKAAITLAMIVDIDNRTVRLESPHFPLDHADMVKILRKVKGDCGCRITSHHNRESAWLIRCATRGEAYSLLSIK